jgi:uncharacterized protein YbjT (DUF2867 family)
MHIVLGGTGHVGSAVVEALLARGAPVTLVTRDAEKAAQWRERGAGVAEADVLDVAALRNVLRRGRRAFLLNPPADPSTDTDAAERATVAAILAALGGAGLEKVVAASTYGAQPGEQNGDFGPLHALEEGLRALSIPAVLQRGAYYMSNWDAQLDPVREGGKLQSFFPADFALPMVSPRDLGEAAAESLLSPPDDVGIRHVEGPRRYTPQDVADAMSDLLGRSVALEVVPRERLGDTFAAMGFSDRAARSYARMTEITLDGPECPDTPLRGTTTLRAHFDTLVT